MNYTQENSFSQKGKVPKTKLIRSVALFDANDGTILHMHHVMTMEGCEPRDVEEIEGYIVGAGQLVELVTKLTLFCNLLSVNASIF